MSLAQGVTARRTQSQLAGRGPRLRARRARETFKLRSPRAPARRGGSAEQRHSAAAASVPALSRRPRLPFARSEGRLAAGPTPRPRSLGGTAGTRVNSPHGQQSRPRPRLPGAEVPPTLRLVPSSWTTLPRMPKGKRLGFRAPAGLHFPECSSRDRAAHQLALVSDREGVRFESFLWRCNCQISFCFIRFLKLTRK